MTENFKSHAVKIYLGSILKISFLILFLIMLPFKHENLNRLKNNFTKRDSNFFITEVKTFEINKDVYVGFWEHILLE